MLLIYFGLVYYVGYTNLVVMLGTNLNIGFRYFKVVKMGNIFVHMYLVCLRHKQNELIKIGRS